MRRMFWIAVGAAGGIWVYQRGADALERARERGVVGNAVAATAAAARVAATTTRAVAVATEQGARLAGRLTAPPAPAHPRDVLAPLPAESPKDAPNGTPPRLAATADEVQP